MNGCRKYISLTVLVAFFCSTLTPIKNANAAPLVAGLPTPGAMVNLSATYTPLLIKGLRVHPENPLVFDFIVDTGNSPIKSDSKELRAQSEKLIKYFLATLTIPEKDLWVNLSPYEKDRIIEEPLGQTELGRDMLAQDYMLKQLTASLVYPEKELGKKFWDKVYAQARERFGVTNIPVNTFNKVWIMPDQADIFVRNNTAFVVNGHLKVMLEEDYLASKKNSVASTSENSQIIREIILPEIEKEVNTGKNFAPLRQIFNSMILASWYKKSLKEALLNQVYANKAKINGVDVDDKAIKAKIYEQYLQAYKKGVFNYIKETQTVVGQTIPKKYFSGGEVFTKIPVREISNPSPAMVAPVGSLFAVNAAMSSDMNSSTADAAMNVIETKSAAEIANMLLISSKKDSNQARKFNTWYISQRMMAFDENVVFDVDAAARMLNVYLSALERMEAFSGKDIERILAYSERGFWSDAAMNVKEVVAELETKGVPKVVIDNINAGVIKDRKYLEVIKLLADIGEQSLLSRWSAPDVLDDNKRAMLDQIIQLNQGYTGGLKGYKANGSKLLRDSLEGKSPFEGWKPSVPKGTDLTRMNAEYFEMENVGLKAFNRTAGVLVAGGVGDRLGYKGIKVGIPLDLVSEKTYLQHYIETMLALQEKSNRLNNEDIKVPLVIMTSDDTHAQTIKILTDNKFFGMDGLSVNPTKDQVLGGQAKQIIILKQGMVPAMVDNDGHFIAEEGDPYKLQVKPHGHGDIHMLIHQAGLDEFWLKEGRTHTFFFQDTNGQVFNAILPGLANSIRKKFALNFLTVSREVAEKAGAITSMTDKNGKQQTYNVEYNEVEPFMKANGYPEGDLVDPNQPGMSLLPGNLNVFIAENSIYSDKLNSTGGIFGEFINPKYSDATKTTFKPTRSETMMQDYAKVLPGELVGVTNFNKRDVFSPVKNSMAEALAKIKGGNSPDSMATGESDFYKSARLRFALAGVDVNVEGKKVVTAGIPYNDGAKIVLSPSFATTIDEIKKKVKGGRISERSVLSIEGEDVVLDNVDLDGSLYIKIAKGVFLTIHDLVVKNRGVEQVELKAHELNDPEIPQFIRMRGYEFLKYENKSIVIEEPGVYEIGSDGELKKAKDQAMATQDQLEQKLFATAQMGAGEAALVATLNQKPLTIEEQRSYLEKARNAFFSEVQAIPEIMSGMQDAFKRFHITSITFESARQDQLPRNLEALKNQLNVIKNTAVQLMQKAAQDKINTLLPILVQTDKFGRKKIENLQVLQIELNALKNSNVSADQQFDALKIIFNKLKALDQAMTVAELNRINVLYPSDESVRMLDKIKESDIVSLGLVNSDEDIEAPEKARGFLNGEFSEQDLQNITTVQRGTEIFQFLEKVGFLVRVNGHAISSHRSQLELRSFIEMNFPENLNVVDFFNQLRRPSVRYYPRMPELLVVKNATFDVIAGTRVIPDTASKGQKDYPLGYTSAVKAIYFSERFLERMKDQGVKLDDLLVFVNAGETPKERAEMYAKYQAYKRMLANRDDQAQLANPGGIDLNTKGMRSSVTGDKIDIQFDPAMVEQFKRGDFTGVRPVILNVTPLTSVLPLLGLAPRREDDVALGV